MAWVRAWDLLLAPGLGCWLVSLWELSSALLSAPQSGTQLVWLLAAPSGFLLAEQSGCVMVSASALVWDFQLVQVWASLKACQLSEAALWALQSV